MEQPTALDTFLRLFPILLATVGLIWHLIKQYFDFQKLKTEVDNHRENHNSLREEFTEKLKEATESHRGQIDRLGREHQELREALSTIKTHFEWIKDALADLRKKG